MKKIVLSILLISLITIESTAQKIAYYNSNELAKVLPDIKKIDSSVEAYSKFLSDEYSYMKDEFDAKSKKLADSSKLKDITKNLLKKDLFDIANKLNEYSNAAQNKIAQKRNELLGPIISQINTKIKSIAKEKGYDFVFDSSQLPFTYADEKYDITTELKKRMGK